jgi:hypothetical protein
MEEQQGQYLPEREGSPIGQDIQTRGKSFFRQVYEHDGKRQWFEERPREVGGKPEIVKSVGLTPT